MYVRSRLSKNRTRGCGVLGGTYQFTVAVVRQHIDDLPPSAISLSTHRLPSSSPHQHPSSPSIIAFAIATIKAANHRAPLRSNHRAPLTTVLLYALRLPLLCTCLFFPCPSLWKLQHATIAYQPPARHLILTRAFMRLGEIITLKVESKDTIDHHIACIPPDQSHADSNSSLQHTAIVRQNAIENLQGVNMVKDEYRSTY
ncbi:hypothetical protein L2E82_16500 [Cichorium intybus]|uniref:Uncharacterized protein n=1 Tax=Cichorium intybus TaxID=13427 RepID=A0ACB9F5R1_CICIN|nr:hypothetical protein L2E82_16500 [Cichorium intybus]